MIGTLKPYPAMRDSGVPWLGRLPEHWRLQRMKTLLCERVQKGFPDEPLLAATQSKGVVRKEQYENRTVLALKDLHLLKLVQEGDFVISLRSFQGGIEYAREQGIISPAYTILFAAFSEMHGFLARLFKSAPFVENLSLYVSGIRQGQNIDYMKLGRSELPVPPLADQVAIVRFLDYVDRRIRRYIRAKQKLIKLLEEQKQAIIHRAVTRGLDPNVRLKPTGVEWLGDVPEHWEVRQLRRLVRKGRRITYGIVQPGEPDASGRFMVRGQDYSFGWVRPEMIFRVSDAIETPYKRSRLATGDLVFTIVGAGVGNVAIVPNWLDGANITQTTARISVDPEKAAAAFIAAVLHGPAGRRNVELYVKGAAQPGLNLEHVRVFLVPVPPVDEQRRIVAAIDRDVSSLLNSAERAEREIGLLREYRTRLIADVVTGKLDVREAATQLPEEVEQQEPLDETEIGNGAEEVVEENPGDVSEESEG